MGKSKSHVRNAVTHPNYIGALGDQVASSELNKFLSNTNKTVLVTDNKITVPTNDNQIILNIAPEFYGIHYMPFFKIQYPTTLFIIHYFIQLTHTPYQG